MEVFYLLVCWQLCQTGDLHETMEKRQKYLHTYYTFLVFKVRHSFPNCFNSLKQKRNNTRVQQLYNNSPKQPVFLFAMCYTAGH